MSEHEEYMPLCGESKDGNNCIECRKKLDIIRDGTIDENSRCHNCYWREQNKRARREKDIIPLICDCCGKSFDWTPNSGDYCIECTV